MPPSWSKQCQVRNLFILWHQNTKLIEQKYVEDHEKDSSCSKIEFFIDRLLLSIIIIVVLPADMAITHLVPSQDVYGCHVDYSGK